MERQVRTRSGEIRTVLIAGELIRLGGQDCLLTTATDITQRKRAEEALRNEAIRRHILVDQSRDGMVVLDSNGKVYEANQKYADMLGYSREEILDLHVWDWDTQWPKEHLLEMIRAVDEVGDHFETRHRRKDGSYYDVEISTNGAICEGQKLIFCVCRDITERKQLEAQLMHSQKMETVGTLAGGIAHDFNNLLHGVMGYADLLLVGKDREHPDYRSLQSIVKAAQRGSDLTQQLLAFSRKLESNLRPVDLNHEVVSTRNLLERTVPKMIEIELDLAADLKTVNADATQMEQVLVNLAVNAKDAMPEGGRLTIQTRNTVLGEDYHRVHPEVKPGEYILLSVSDTGHGIDPDTLEHIFDPFYTTKARAERAGLGLAMVYGIVNNHEGHISCSSEPNRGTTFSIYLPVLEDELEIERSDEMEMPQGGTETILLVDDEEFVRTLGEQSLSMFGYTVLTADDGESALEVYAREQERISLVLLDLIMPRMSGQRCLEKILQLNPAAKVIVASGYSDVGPMQETIEAGARDFIGKPYQIKRLLEVVREVLDENAAAA